MSTASGEKPPTDLIDLSEYRLQLRSPFWRIVGAIVATLVFIGFLGFDIFLVIMLSTGRWTVSDGLGASLALAIVFPIATLDAAWLFWVSTIKGMANLATGDEFRRSRSAAFKKADHRFAVIALGSLLVLPLVPFLTFLD